MKLVRQAPRSGWQQRVEESGLVYHTVGTPASGGARPYWDESCHYEFTLKEVEEMELATSDLQRMCLDAAQHVIHAGRYKEFGIPLFAVPAIEAMWEAEPPALYGRMDLAYNGTGPAKLLEYNADTPTALLEAAVIQWHWLEDLHPKLDQWNSLHDKLIAKWKDVKYLFPNGRLHFGYIEDAAGEDEMTIAYLRETAEAAGLKTMPVKMEDIQIAEERGGFVFTDGAGWQIESIFKLYPWEWLIHEASGPQALASMLDRHKPIIWMEPIWKMLLSNKMLLAILWELFPEHPNLLPAYASDVVEAKTLIDGDGYVIKPLLSREGANVSITKDGMVVAEQAGDYGEEGHIIQALGPTQQPGGEYVVIGSWLIDQDPAGMGIRVSDGPITSNLARFVPHLIRD